MAATNTQDQVGIAMPLTLIALVILSALMIALAVLTQSEPVIATNQYRGAVGRALAVSGAERAVWALTAGSRVSGGVDPPSIGVGAGPPYDGATPITMGAGGFTLEITGVSTSEVKIEAVGWTPSNTSPGSAYRKITASLMRFPDFGLNAPCALCVKGDLDVTGSATIDTRGDTSCGRKYGAYTTGYTATLGTASIWGAIDGNDTSNEATDVLVNAPASDFDAFTLGPHHLAVLRQMARESGTYIGPGSPPLGQTNWNGAVTFDAAHPITRDGVVFVDTISGNAPTPDNPADYANVGFQGSPFSMGDFRGWIIVMGNVTALNATGTIRGLLYVMNALTSSGTADPVNGLVVVQSLDTTQRSQTDVPVSFSCANANGAGKIPRGWFLVAGSYKEVSGH
jgi:hypothetical protein